MARTISIICMATGRYQTRKWRQHLSSKGTITNSSLAMVATTANTAARFCPNLSVGCGEIMPDSAPLLANMAGRGCLQPQQCGKFPGRGNVQARVHSVIAAGGDRS